MNNKGFMFIETIITTVILATTLLALYSTYNNVIMSEKNRLYHDDIAYVYKTKHINDILEMTVDSNLFSNQYKCFRYGEGDDCHKSYIYFFNYGSSIYSNTTSNTTLIEEAYNIYNWTMLAYVDFNDIADIKDCIAKNLDDTICKNTLEDINRHAGFGTGKSPLLAYLSAIDVPTEGVPDDYDGILISMFYEAKDGSKLLDTNYDQCLKNKENENDYDPESSEESSGNLYGMACEKAPYISWVYTSIGGDINA